MKDKLVVTQRSSPNIKFNGYKKCFNYKLKHFHFLHWVLVADGWGFNSSYWTDFPSTILKSVSIFLLPFPYITFTDRNVLYTARKINVFLHSEHIFGGKNIVNSCWVTCALRFQFCAHTNTANGACVRRQTHTHMYTQPHTHWQTHTNKILKTQTCKQVRKL